MIMKMGPSKRDIENVQRLVETHYRKLKDDLIVTKMRVEKEEDFDAILWRLAGAIVMLDMMGERLRTLERIVFDEPKGPGPIVS